MLIGHFSFPSRAVLRKEYYVQSLSHLKTNKGEPCKSANWVKLPTDNGTYTQVPRLPLAPRQHSFVIFKSVLNVLYIYMCHVVVKTPVLVNQPRHLVYYEMFLFDIICMFWSVSPIYHKLEMTVYSRYQTSWTRYHFSGH